MTLELVLAGNGPGELSGWVRPVAQAARDLGIPDLRLTLVLSPSQFAGGREADVVRDWMLFDRVVTPATGVRIALGLERLMVADSAAVVHLGGDLWFSARLSRRLRVSACAFAETTLIARRHGSFAGVFAASETLANQLRSAGVPAEKIAVTGDPRVDAIRQQLREETQAPSPSPSPQRGEGMDDRRPGAPSPPEPLASLGFRASPPSSPWPQGNSSVDDRRSTIDHRLVVSFMPGSRDRFFRFLVPYYLQVADALVGALPGVRFQIVCSKFLSPEVVSRTRDEARRRWPHLVLTWVMDDPWPALAGSDLVLTIPGTNTLELAMAGISFGVVVDMSHADQAPLEGAAEWLGRLPWLGPAVKRAGVARYVATRRFVALPNLHAGRMIVPEWVGRWTPQDLADRLSELLRNPEWREAIRTELQILYGGTGGASRVIAEQAVALAQQTARTHP